MGFRITCSNRHSKALLLRIRHIDKLNFKLIFRSYLINRHEYAVRTVKCSVYTYIFIHTAHQPPKLLFHTIDWHILAGHFKIARFKVIGHFAELCKGIFLLRLLEAKCSFIYFLWKCKLFRCNSIAIGSRRLNFSD